MGTSVSLAANSFTLSSMSDKRQVLSWIERLENRQRNSLNTTSSTVNVITYYFLDEFLREIILAKKNSVFWILLSN